MFHMITVKTFYIILFFVLPFVTSFPSLPLGRMTTKALSFSTHKEFTTFHGMLCNPMSANRCIKAFNGTILFMPSNYKEKGIATYHTTNLNLVTYYLLVLWSLTGLSTLLRMTHFIETKEDLKNGLISPEITEDIVTYINQESGSDQGNQLTVIRRYAFYFRLCGVRVKMFHLQSSDKADKLHLVEIYEPITFSQLVSTILIALAAIVVSYFVSSTFLFKTIG